jgi:putative hydrolase of the HAD superfamily
MIIIFDLDDTLYREIEYVHSGLAAVARFGAERFGLPAKQSFGEMRSVLEAEGRGHVFDRWLARHGLASKGRIEECVRVYRHHEPRIRLEPAVRSLLRRLSGQPLYIVTDGHKIVQDRKIEALGLRPMVKRVFITHRYGVRHAKPSVHCFERIREIEGCRWKDMVYVGDNPAKDFVNLNRLGMPTIRVLTGMHAGQAAAPGYEAQFVIDGLAQLEPTLGKIEHAA